ncbi:hypothetical protein TNCT_73511 [Trichonephila clavata]|uniref:Uncharacterized protein n=1 Tax=Trichonephila clavata TaxID=2740835 RepID=A0A8X6KFC5_TRICU|nr:hypothetical protein TNCT_73511 [Trichonephila clavata]
MNDGTRKRPEFILVGTPGPGVTPNLVTSGIRRLPDVSPDASLSRRRRLPRVFPHFRGQPCFALPRPRLRSVNAFLVAPTRRGVRFRPTTVAGCSSCFAPLERPSWYQVPEPAAPLVMVRIAIATTCSLSLKFEELTLNKYTVSTAYEKSYFTDVQK